MLSLMLWNMDLDISVVLDVVESGFGNVYVVTNVVENGGVQEFTFKDSFGFQISLQLIRNGYMFSLFKGHIRM